VGWSRSKTDCKNPKEYLRSETIFMNPTNQKTRALITGGAGFIGSHLAETLLEHGQQVTIIDDLSTGRFENIAHLTNNSRFRFAIDTITNESVLDRLASECQVIYHLAAAVGVRLIVEKPVHTIETNIMGTEAVLRAARRYRAKTLIASTSEVYGKSNQVPFREDDDVVLGPTFRSRWSYAATKMVDEFLGLAYHQEQGLPVTFFRLFNTVGPRQIGRYGMVIPRLVQQALNGEPLSVYSDGKMTRCFMHVQDAVRAIMALSEEPLAVGQVFNVGATDEISILDLARTILAVVDGSENLPPSNDPRLKFIPYEQAYTEGFEDMRRRVPDTSKIKQLTGWGPKFELRKILEDVIEDINRS
jgi:UDP-glucose 4-epimerase